MKRYETEKAGLKPIGGNHIQVDMVALKTVDAVMQHTAKHISSMMIPAMMTGQPCDECIACAQRAAAERIKEIVTDGEYKPVPLPCFMKQELEQTLGMRLPDGIEILSTGGGDKVLDALMDLLTGRR